MTIRPDPLPPAPLTDDGDNCFRRRVYAVLWAASLVVCPVAMWAVAIHATRGPRPEGRFGLRDPIVNPEYIFGVHLLISCFTAWAAFTVWGRWWLVGWGVVLLAGLMAFAVGVSVVVGIFYG